MIAQAFPRRVRLTNKAQYSRVFNELAKQQNSFSMRIIASPQLTPSLGRVGIIVAKRAIPLAVQRNKIKRLIREWFRHNPTLCKGWDYVVIVKAGSNSLTPQRFREQLSALWLRLIKSQNI